MKNSKLTLDILCVQYDSWLCNYGTRRDENDQRFGQWIHNNFDLGTPELNSEGVTANPDGFYAEKPVDAFEQISVILDR